MKTITAKQLRDNLDAVVQRVRKGEAIKVTYRSQPAFILQPEPSSSERILPGSPEAMQAFVSQAQKINQKHRKSELDPNKSIEQLYKESLDGNGKYQNPHE